MSKQLLVFRWSTTFFVVVLFQVLALMLLVTGTIDTIGSSIAVIQSLPPINFLYVAAGSSWIGAGMAAALFGVGILHIVVAALTVSYGFGRKFKLIRYVTVTMGFHVLMLSASAISCAGVVVYGGMWHLIAFITLSLALFSAAATGVIFLISHKAMRLVGDEHDRQIIVIRQESE